MAKHRFSAHLHHVGLNYAVVVPRDVVRALGGARFIPVKGSADGADFATRLVPAGDDERLLYLDHATREAAGIDIGADVEVEVWLAEELDTAPDLPTDIVAAIRGVTGGWDVWDSFSAAKQQEMLGWIAKAKRPATRERRLERLAETLRKAT